MYHVSKLTIIFFFLIIAGLFCVSKFSISQAQSSSISEQYPTVATSRVNADFFGFIADEFVVTFKDDTTLKSNLTQMLTAQLKSELITEKLYSIKTNKNTNTRIFIKKAAQDNNIKYIDPNFIYFTNYLPNDPAFNKNNNSMWGWLQNKTNVEQAWDITNQVALKSIVVADIDNGVHYLHEDLANVMWDGTNCMNSSGAVIAGGCKHGYDFIDHDIDPLPQDNEVNAHGTEVSGVIAAEANNGKGIAGVAPNAKIMSLKIFNGNKTNLQAFLGAMYFAYYNTPQIVNMSFGGGGSTNSENDALTKLDQKGILVVKAAGNSNGDNDKTPMFPCIYKHSLSICVAASNVNDTYSSFSNYGKSTTHIAAPGENMLLAAYLAGQSKYSNDSGTSFASPFVAGEAALIWGYNPALTAAQVKDIILTSGDPISGSKTTVTNLRVNVYKAILKAQTLLPPTVIPTNTVMPTSTNVPVTITSTAVPTNTLVPTITPTIDPNAPAFYKVIPPATNLGKNIKDLCVTKGAGWYLTDQCKYLASSISYWCIGCEPGSTGGKELDLVIPTTATNMDICCVKEVTITNIPTITVTPHTTITNTPGITVTIVVPSIPPDAVNCGPVDIFNKEGRTPGDQYIDIYDFIAFKGMYGKYCNDNPNIYSPCGSKNLVRSSTATLNKIDILDLQKFADIYHKSYCGNVETINSLPQTGGGTVAEELLKYFTLIVLEVIAGGVIVYQGHRLKRRGWRSASRAEGSK
ncbi:MAG: S8 family serine peptidase [bacterium]